MTDLEPGGAAEGRNFSGRVGGAEPILIESHEMPPNEVKRCWNECPSAALVKIDVTALDVVRDRGAPVSEEVEGDPRTTNVAWRIGGRVEACGPTRSGASVTAGSRSIAG